MPRLPSLTCKVCKKQYTGKTVDRFRWRWDSYKESDMKLLRGKEINKNLCMSNFWDGQQIFEQDVSICLIDKTNSSDSHKRAYYWMRALKTIALFGLNTEETS